VSRLRRFLQSYRLRTGRFDAPIGKSVLICVDGAASECAQNLAACFVRQFPRDYLFFIERNAPAAPLVNGTRIPYPYPLWGAARYLRRLGAVFILVDSGVSPPRHLLTLARRSGITIERVDQWPSDDNGLDVAMAALAAEMARERDEPDSLKRRIKFYLWRNFALHFFARGVERVPSVAVLRQALGNPQRILCLGNGPSSTDLSGADEVYDAVFRVNDRWLDLGLFTCPDVVFTGAAESVRRIGKGPLYGFMDDSSALRIVRKLRGKVKPLRFFTAAELGFPFEDFGPHTPTNGLLMLYLAVVLQPQALTVAGIDLYQDPRGCYPDDCSTPNTYTSVHDSAKEVGAILQFLAAFRGQLTIIGQGALAREYKRYINERVESS
jgi:hypothetical protein